MLKVNKQVSQTNSYILEFKKYKNVLLNLCLEFHSSIC